MVGREVPFRPGPVVNSAFGLGQNLEYGPMDLLLLPINLIVPSVNYFFLNVNVFHGRYGSHIQQIDFIVW